VYVGVPCHRGPSLHGGGDGTRISHIQSNEPLRHRQLQAQLRDDEGQLFVGGGRQHVGKNAGHGCLHVNGRVCAGCIASACS